MASQATSQATKEKSKALVILSGGQDSVTCAAIAQQQFEEVHALTINYGQRHLTEIQSAIAVSDALGLTSHEVVDVGTILVSTSPLVSNSPLGQYSSPEELPGGVEPTFVPMRNLLFLTIAANRAVSKDIEDVYTGVCQADYGGYPDCRADFVMVAKQAIKQARDGGVTRFEIHTPLMDKTKRDSVLLAKSILGDRFESVLGLTHTCYAGVKGGCGKCHACIIRDRGFKDAGIEDPIWKWRKSSGG